MMKKLLILFMFLMTFLSPLAMSPVVSAFDPLKPACDEKDKVRSGAADEICNTSENAADPVTGSEGIITKVANILAFVAAIIAVFVIIIAGITMMTSGGDPGKIASSRNTIIYTVIGLFVIVIARTIVVFIFNRIQG